MLWKLLATVAFIVGLTAVVIAGCANENRLSQQRSCKESEIVQQSLQICGSVQTRSGIPVCVITPADFERALRLQMSCKQS